MRCPRNEYRASSAQPETVSDRAADIVAEGNNDETKRVNENKTYQKYQNRDDASNMKKSYWNVASSSSYLCRWLLSSSWPSKRRSKLAWTHLPEDLHGRFWPLPNRGRGQPPKTRSGRQCVAFSLDLKAEGEAYLLSLV